jgi:hypothetical protein
MVDGIRLILELYNGRPPDSAHALLAVFDAYEPTSFRQIVPKAKVFKSDKKLVFVAANKSERDSDVGSCTAWCREQGFRFLTISISSGQGIKSFLTTIGRDLVRDYMKRRLQTCRDITQMVFDHPQSRIFRDDPSVDVPGYVDVVKNPMWLRRVLEKLDKGQYLTVEKWQSDMDLIWENCKLYNGGSPEFGYHFAPTLEELKRIIRKECMKAFGPSRLDKIAAQLTTTARDVKIAIEKRMGSSTTYAGGESTYSKSDLRLPFNDEDLSNLVSGAAGLTGKQDQQHFAQAVRALGLPTVKKDDCEEIDVADIPDSARIYLRFFLKQRTSRKMDEI